MNTYIVEDDKVLSLILQKMAEKLNLTVVGVAEKGSEAITDIKNKTPDLIFMDIYLKDTVDGIQVTKEIFKHYSPAVIYITGNSDQGNFERAKQIGYHDYLIKPISFNDLNTSIKRIDTSRITT